VKRVEIPPMSAAQTIHTDWIPHLPHRSYSG
jgi:hypothetical protein